MPVSREYKTSDHDVVCNISIVNNAAHKETSETGCDFHIEATQVEILVNHANYVELEESMKNLEMYKLLAYLDTANAC